MGKIIYLTGAPATGKSTLTESLADKAGQVTVFAYSKELMKVVSARAGQLNQDKMRERSAKLITRDDVMRVDRQLVELVSILRQREGFLVIDSHPVTIEDFGFRVTPFDKVMLNRLAPDIIICLYADAETLEDRIKASPAGRPLPPKAELERHVDLQCQVASIYAIETGASLYFLDASRPSSELLANFMQVTRLPVHPAEAKA